MTRLGFHERKTGKPSSFGNPVDRANEGGRFSDLFARRRRPLFAALDQRNSGSVMNALVRLGRSLRRVYAC